MDVGALAAEISDRVRALEDPKVPAVRVVRREFSKRVAHAEPRRVVDLALALLGRPGVPRFVGDELIVHHRTALATLDAADLIALGRGMDSWEKVDCFGGYLAGPAWRRGQIENSLIHEWARSPDRWWRRAALVSTVGLNVKTRGGSGDTRRTLAVCRMLVNDRDDMVVKAMSWALRALSLRNPDAVRKFVDERRGDLAARVVREVENKLTTGLKNPRGTRGARGPKSRTS